MLITFTQDIHIKLYAKAYKEISLFDINLSAVKRTSLMRFVKSFKTI